MHWFSSQCMHSCVSVTALKTCPFLFGKMESIQSLNEWQIVEHFTVQQRLSLENQEELELSWCQKGLGFNLCSATWLSETLFSLWACFFIWSHSLWGCCVFQGPDTWQMLSKCQCLLLYLLLDTDAWGGAGCRSTTQASDETLGPHQSEEPDDRDSLMISLFPFPAKQHLKCLI